VVKTRLYYSSKEKPLDLLCNQGFDEVITLLKNQGSQYEIIDTTTLSEEELYSAYSDAWVPSVYKKFRIRRVFGSRRHSGWLFGKGVPALLIYEKGKKYPIDVYPHEERGRIITIKEYLEKL